MKKTIILLTALAASLFAQFSRETDSLALLAIAEKNPRFTYPWKDSSDAGAPIDTWKRVRLDGDRVSYLEFWMSDLDTLPPELGNLTALDTLKVGLNRFSEYPPVLATLTNLTYLRLYSNRVGEFPEEIRSLTNLKFLEVSESLTEVPSWIGELTELTNLQLGNNKLTSLPAEINSLTKLKVLELRTNNLDFEDLAIISPRPSGFYYVWQSLTEVGDTVPLTDQSEIVANVGGTGNSYKWYNYDQLIEGETGSRLKVNAPGVYNFKVNNPSFPDLTITSDKYGFTSGSRETDSLALVDIANANPALKAEWQSDWDNNLPITEWTGVWVRDDRVYSITFDAIQITTIPPAIGELSALTNFRTESGLISELPKEMSKLSLLEKITLGKTQITDLPHEIASIPSLRSIGMWGGEITEIPSIANKLKDNVYFYLRRNKIAALPANINELHVYKLTIDENQLEFDAIETLISLSGTNGFQLDYTPQDTLGTADTTLLHTPVTLNGTIGGSSNNYQWHKDGSVLADSTSATITVNTPGVYHCEVTSGVVSGLTLVQAPKTVLEVTREMDSLALVAIRNAVNNKEFFFPNWNDETPLDQWNNIQLNGDGRVKRLIISHNQAEFDGEIAEELGNLSALEYLYITPKGDTPKLPNTLNNLVKLRTLSTSSSSDSLFAIDTLRLPSLTQLRISNYSGDSLPFVFIKPLTIYLTELPNVRKLPPVTDVTSHDIVMESVPQFDLETGLVGYTPYALHLKRMGYTQIPSALEQFTSVRDISLENNSISSIDIDLTKLSNLQGLNLTGNRFTEIPEALYNGSVARFHLTSNNIREIPAELFDNTAIQNVYLDSNQIESLPARMGSLPFHITALVLENNQISELPAGFGDVVPFPSTLNLEYNRLSKLPETLLEVHTMNHFKYNRFPLKEIERLRPIITDLTGDANAFYDKLYFSQVSGPHDTIVLIEGEEGVITVPVPDEEDYTLTHSWHRAGVYLNKKQREITIPVVQKRDAGTYRNHMKVTELNNMPVHTDSVVVVVTSKPEFTSGNSVDAVERSPFKYQAAVEDNSIPLTYTFSNLPSWLSADADSVFGTPPTGSGDTSFTVKADVGPVSTEMSVTITVEDLPDTTFSEPRDSLVPNDSISIDIDSVYSEKSDTVITTIRTTVKFDSAFTIVDTLIDGDFHNDSIAVEVTVTETPIDTTVETLEYVPTLSENRRDTVITGYDTLVSVDSVYELQDTIVTTIRTQWVKDSLFTLIDSLSDNVIFWDTTILQGITNSSVPIDTTIDTLKEYMEEITTSHSIAKDTVTTIDSTVLTNKDTVVTTVKTENWIDTLFTRTDSLYHGESFWFKVDTTVTSGSDIVATLLDTLKYQPELSEKVTTSTVTVFDTVITLDSLVLPTEDTVVTTTTTENWIDSLFTRTDSLSDGVSFWFKVDTTVTSGSELLSTTTDTLYADQVELSTVNKRLLSPHFAAFPNPVPLSENEVLFVLPEGIAGSAQITVYDMLGNIIDQQDLVIAEQNDIRWDLTNRYGQQVSSGSYVALLRVTLNNGSTQMFKTAVGVKQ